MYDSIFLLLALLFTKHWYVDFVNQTAEEVEWKGTFLDWRGLKHSLKHGLATGLILYFATNIGALSIVLGIFDFLVHYHIDWAKININNRKNYTPQTKEFWVWLGLDQLAHSLTYIFIVWTLT